MSNKISISVILLSCAYCSHLQELFSSYFIFSFQKHPREGFHSIGEFHAGTELACALRCSRDDTCEGAIFHNALKKCALYQKKGKCSRGSDVDEKEEKSRIWTMRKVRNFLNINFFYFQNLELSSLKMNVFSWEKSFVSLRILSYISLSNLNGAEFRFCGK